MDFSLHCASSSMGFRSILILYGQLPLVHLVCELPLEQNMELCLWHPLAPTGTHTEEAQLSYYCSIWQRRSCVKNVKINMLGTKQIGKKRGSKAILQCERGFWK